MVSDSIPGFSASHLSGEGSDLLCHYAMHSDYRIQCELSDLGFDRIIIELPLLNKILGAIIFGVPMTILLAGWPVRLKRHLLVSLFTFPLALMSFVDDQIIEIQKTGQVQLWERDLFGERRLVSEGFLSKERGLELQKKENKRKKKSTRLIYSVRLRLEEDSSNPIALKSGKAKHQESLERFCVFLANRYDQECILPEAME